MSDTSTSAYVIVPESGAGPGVLVLHSWFGLTAGIKIICHELADAGFCALAPDLFDGQTAETPEDGQALLTAADPNNLVLGIQSTADALRRMPATPDGPIGVVGYSMGASLGLWLSEREPDTVAAAVSFYGSQSMDFTDTQAAYQFHMTVDDDMIDADERVLMQASLHLAGRTVDVHDYDHVGHWFAEPGSPNHDEQAAAIAWARTVAFLDEHVPSPTR